MELPDESDEDYLARRHLTRFVILIHDPYVGRVQRRRYPSFDYKLPSLVRVSYTTNAVRDEVLGVASHNDVPFKSLDEPVHSLPQSADQHQPR